MKIMVILGGSHIMSETMAEAYKKATPKMLKCGVSGNEVTPFSDHEIIVTTPEEALGTFLEHSPDKLIFAGTFNDGNEFPPFILVQRILTQSMDGDRSRFLYMNPISVLPFHKEPNFFLFMDIVGMANWFGLS